MTTPEKNTQTVLERIREGSLPMRSRTYFTLRAAGVVLVAILAFVLSVYLFNLVLFILFTGGRAPLLTRGGNGLMLFARHFPWWVLLLDIGLLVLLRSLLKRYSFGYRTPTLYIVFGLLVAMGSLGFVLYHHTDVNDRIEHAAHHGQVPSPVGSFFDDARHAPADND